MRRAPALSTHGVVSGVRDVRIMKVVRALEAPSWPIGDVLVMSDDGLLTGSGITIKGLRDPTVVEAGDVVQVRAGSSQVRVLYRRGANANFLFVTERCNSRCLMCSQPPRDEDDTWRVAELLQTIALVDRDEPQLGFTGGEPTLLGRRLGDLLTAARTLLPDTHIHVLTNGRLFADSALARDLVGAGSKATTWAVPLYADVASIHDEIVDAPGAFDETLEGLYQLASNKARVEVRIVLHALSIPRLPQLASYIYRRLPFAEHVTFMGLEPMGFARANRDRLWIDPMDYAETLASAVHHLAVRGMNVSIYNLPYCVLPNNLWAYARQSISGWKNVDDQACAPCAKKETCAGFFLSADRAWRSRGINPIKTGTTHELA